MTERAPGVLRRNAVRRNAWWLLAASVTTLPLLAVLAGGHTLVWRDTARQHAPVRGMIVDALRHLHLPLWNPHEACGVPLFAQLMHGVLHPVSVLGAWLAPWGGVDALIVAYAALAAAGAAVLARRLGTSAPAALAAGLAYGLSGYVLSMGSALHCLAGAASAPWAVLALREAGRDRRRLALAALAVFCLHAAGDAQWTVLAVALALALAWAEGGRRGAAAALLGAALGTALAAIQLWPTAALATQSMRGTATLTDEERTLWALGPWRVLEFALPGFFGGRPGPLAALVFVKLGGTPLPPGTVLPTHTLPLVPSVFVGTVVLALAGAGARTSRAGRTLAAAGLVLLWLALGFHLGAEQLLRSVPVWSSFRYAEKMTGPLALCVALLAGLGLDRVAARPGRGRAWTCAAALGALCAVLAGATALALQDPVRTRLAVGLVHAAVALAAFAALLRMRGRWSATRLATALALLVGLELLAASPYALHAGARDAREPRPLAELADLAHAGTAARPGDDPVVRIGTPLRGAGRWLPRELDGLDGMLALESRMGVVPFAAPSGIGQIESYSPFTPRGAVVADDALGWPDDPKAWPYRRRYTLTHVVVRDPLSPREQHKVTDALDGATLVKDDRTWHFGIYAVPHRPWASFAARAVTAHGEDEVLRALADVAPRGWDEVVLEGAAPGPLAPGRVLHAARDADGGHLRVEAECDGAGLLVVNDAAWPGWSATLDGRPVPLLRADAFVRAVAWPAGRHVLEMRYAPPEVRRGALVSALAAVVLVLLAAWDARGRRRRDHAPVSVPAP